MITLFQFPISHYCEKIRWALEFKGVDYQYRNLMPGLHLRTMKKITGRRTAVPMIDVAGEYIQGSSRILDYLDTTYPEHPLMPSDKALAEEVVAWEKEFDKYLGDHVRRFCYHYYLERKDLVVPFFTQDNVWWGTWFYKVGFGQLVPLMRKVMVIREPEVTQSREYIEALLEKLGAHYDQHAYLVGDQFTRADLTAAALLAPLVMEPKFGLVPPKEIPSEIAQLAQKHEKNLAFVSRLYQQHRLKR